MRNNFKIYIILSVVVFFLGFAYLRYNFIQGASLIQNNEEEILPVFSKFLNELLPELDSYWEMSSEHYDSTNKTYSVTKWYQPKEEIDMNEHIIISIYL